ncbi:MAG: response regulator transcription factor [Chloroflexi bacterium]|nr:response regulator transcription factor [Chloroflexota bacterium]
MLVDDHDMVRRGLAVMLQAFDDLQLVGEASNGAEAVRSCAEHHPDVVLMDLVMPEMDGVAATRAIRQNHPEVQVIVLTSFYDKGLVQDALKAGAIGYLLKNALIDDVAKAIRAAHAGQPTLAPEATQALIAAATGPPPPGHDLTRREREVLALLVEGLNNPEIAARLSISRSTVKSHVSNILAKMGVSSRVEAVSLALKHDLSPPPDR